MRSPFGCGHKLSRVALCVKHKPTPVGTGPRRFRRLGVGALGAGRPVRMGFPFAQKAWYSPGTVQRALPILAALWLCGCASGAENDGLHSSGIADPLAPIDSVAEPQAPFDAPAAEPVWVLNAFSFLYPEADETVDALDIDQQASTSEVAPATDACAHDDFVGPGGEAAVDHQLLRLTTTFESLNEGGIADQIINSAVKNGSMTILVSVSDERVRVVMGLDPPLTGSDGEVLPFASFRPYEDLAYHGDLGPPTWEGDTLVAGPGDVRLRMNIQIVEADLFLRDAFVRLTVRDDGRVHGVLQGYWSSEDIVTVLASTPAHLGALGYTLEEFQAVLDAHADFDPAEDGVCRALSAAFGIAGQPAFLIEEGAE